MMIRIMSTSSEQERAVRLAVAVKRLRGRLREVTLAGATDLSLTELSIIRRLRQDGPATAATLAASEHVSQQAIAQNLSELKSTGLVQADLDPTDGRKRLISVTDEGNRLFDSVSALRDAWLADAIDATVSESELPALDKAIELLERLADADKSGTTR